MQSPFEAISVLEHEPAAVVRALEARLGASAPSLLLYFVSSRADFAGIARAIAER